MKNSTKKWILLLTSSLVVGLPQAGFCASVQKKVEKTIKKAESEVNRDKVKEKFHEVAEAIDVEKIDEKVDRAADYFDVDKLKAQIDQIADALDREKLKEFIDIAAEYLDRDKIKAAIDMVADLLDREKVKAFIHEIAANIDKEQIKEKFDQSVDKVADSLETVVSSLEKDLTGVGNNPYAIQNLLHGYDWNKWIPNQASSGPATLSNLKLGGGKNVIVVSPGQRIDGEVQCALNKQACSPLSLYRVVLGIKNRGGQTTIFNHFGIKAGKEVDRFTLVAPRQKGIYQLAFRVATTAREATAIEAWDKESDANLGHPAPIGLIIVQ